MKKNGSKVGLAVALGAAAAAAAGMVYAAAKILGDVAIKREVMPLPKGIQNKLSGGFTSDPNLEQAIKAGEDARKIETETVSITTDEGLMLTGHFRPCENPKRVVIAMHGWRSSWENDYGASCQFYHENGCAMLYPDQRCTGESEGEYIGFGVLERHDCLAWINYALERFGPDMPIYLVGISMGATTVLMTLGFPLPANVKGVIADCGFTSPKAIWSHVINENMGISDKLSYPILNYICNKKAQYDGDEYSTVTALSENVIPVLFVHGGADKFVPIHMTFENYEACKGEREIFVVPGAGHGMSFLVDTEGYQRKVLKFFKKHD